MTKNKHYHVTFTGIYGDLRRRGKEILKKFNVVYSGSLIAGETSHLICDPASLSTLLSATAPSDKLRLAVEANIPTVSYHWLDDSASAGRMLPPSQYLIDLESSLPALTEASWTAKSSELSPIERLREASVHHASGAKPGFFETDNVLSPGLSLLADAAANGKASAAAEKDHPYSFEELQSPEGISKDQQNSKVDISFGSAGDLGGFGLSPGGGSGGSPASLPAIPEEKDPEAEEVDICWDADQCYANTIAADFSNLKIAKPRSHCRVQRSSLSRYSAWGAAHPPLSMVIAGPASAKKPSAKTLAGIKQMHGNRTPFFFSSLLAKMGHAPQVEVTFQAGDLAHGVKIIYDTDTQTGQQIFAHAIIKSIYALAGNPDQLWMEHHYMFTSDDMQDRPAWRRALRDEEPVEDEELLLSANVYHSPCHLIVGDFGVDMMIAEPLGRKETQQKNAAVPVAGTTEAGNYFPLLSCSRAFDVAEKRIVTLSKALQDH